MLFYTFATKSMQCLFLIVNVKIVFRCSEMSSLNPIENGLTSDDQEAPETLSNPSPPPSETIERVENYNSVIPDSVTQNILESSGLNNTSPEVNIVNF